MLPLHPPFPFKLSPALLRRIDHPRHLSRCMSHATGKDPFVFHQQPSSDLCACTAFPAVLQVVPTAAPVLALPTGHAPCPVTRHQLWSMLSSSPAALGRRSEFPANRPPIRIPRQSGMRHHSISIALQPRRCIPMPHPSSMIAPPTGIHPPLSSL